jgi:hypothetical protein
MYLNVENDRFLYNCNCSCIPLRFDVHDSEMDTVLKNFLWKKEPNPKIFYIYGGAILVFKGIFFQHLNQNNQPPVIKNCKILQVSSPQEKCFPPCS